MDPFGRAIDYLRISITDRCDERCLYCRPESYQGWQPSGDTLTDDEILAIVGAAADLGFRKFRLTGGEPLIRPGIVDLARRIWEVPGVRALGLSTNATHLAPVATALRQAGVRSVNISLDTLDPDRYHRITGGRLDRVLAGIEAARDAAFERVKLNCVLLRGINEPDLWPLVQFAAARDLPLRLIELMPMSSETPINAKTFFSATEAMQLLSEQDRLRPEPDARIGHGPARYYRLQQTGALVGFIGALTNPCFCETCNKVRLTADGKLRPCLGQLAEIDLLDALRPELDMARLRQFLDLAIAQKPREHDFLKRDPAGRPMTAIGG